MATYEIGKRIKKAREDCGMTQEEFLKICENMYKG